jgi:hypothetical protein
MDLYNASNQWITRPPDQRFWNLEDLHGAVRAHRDSAAIGRSDYRALAVAPEASEVALVGANGGHARLTHWAFGQLCARIGAPAAYLRTLPTELVCQNINHGLNELKYSNGPATAVILLDRTATPYLARAFVTDSYTRIWNVDLVRRLRDLSEGWRVPPARPAFAGQPNARPATEADVLSDPHGLSVNVGDLIAPAGLYASFEDMFVFMINEDRRIDDGSPGGLSRGFFLSNSEVGKAAFRLTTFYYRHVCGNHIVWDASGVQELAIRHVGKADERFGQELQLELRKYADTGALIEEQKIRKARDFLLGHKKDEVIDLIFQKGLLSRKRATEAYEIAEKNDEKPETAWGLASGITRISQLSAYTDQRVELDKTAGKVIELAF